jgi:hypothetical protein
VLAHEERQRLFILPEDLYQHACTALQLIEHITSTRQQVAELLAQEAYQQACGTIDYLEHMLAEAGAALHEEEATLRQQARARLQTLQSAEQALSQVRAATALAPQPVSLAPASVPAESDPARLLHLLVSAWDALHPQQTARAAALRHELAHAWLTLAQHSADTHQRILREAQARLQDLPMWERFTAGHLARHRPDTAADIPGNEQREQSAPEAHLGEPTRELQE